MPYKVRFHLANGPHYMKWQVKDVRTGEVSYYDPDTTSLYLTEAVLRNRPKSALKIYHGDHKTVVAWIECMDVIPEPQVIRNCDMKRQLMYNPRVAPNWRDDAGNNIDGEHVDEIMTSGRNVFKLESVTSLVPSEDMA